MAPDLHHELLAHARALRALARDLVGEQGADDLVQETAVQALRKPPRPGPIAGWLFTVLRRLAMKQRRGESRRSARERQAARPEALAPDFAGGDRELFARLNAAVLELPEPYQGTIMLRYLRDLPAAAIAQQTGVPLATVKTRLWRGLALLRQRLDRTGSDWRLGLAAAFGLRALPVGAGITTGVTLMGTAVKITIAGMAAALTLAALWWLRDSPPAAMPVAATPPRAPLAVVAAVEPTAPPPATPTRIEVTPTTAALPASVHGRCVDAAGAPLAGCRVQLHGVPGSRARAAAWQQQYGPFRWTDPPTQTTAEDGTFALQVAPSGPLCVEIQVAAHDCATAAARWSQLDPGEDLDLGDVVLRRQVAVHALAVDEQGRPLAGTDLFLVTVRDPAPLLAPPASQTVSTDGLGRAELQLAAGHWSVRCSRPGSSFQQIDVPADRREIDARLVFEGAAALASLRGLVTGPDGAPLADVQIKAGAEPDQIQFLVWTNADGRFQLQRGADTSDAPIHLHCRRDGFDPYVSPEPVPWNNPELQIVLRPAACAVLRVRSDDGAPVLVYRALLRPAADEIGGIVTRGHHARGEHVLDPLARGDYLLSVAPDDDALAGRFSQRVHVDGDGMCILDVLLPRSVRRTLRVSSDDGAPLPGVRFELIDPDAKDRPRLDTHAVPFAEWQDIGGDNLALLLQDGRTDERGEAILRGPPDQLLAVRLPGGLPLLQLDVSLTEAQPLRLAVPRGACLRGQLGPADFLARLRTTTAWQGSARLPAAMQEPNPSVQLDPLGQDAATMQVPVADDGSFVADGLRPGTWTLSLCAALNGESGGRTQRQFATLELGAGARLERRFDLAHLTFAHVLGIVQLDGAPAAGMLHLQGGQSDVDADSLFDVTLAADGSFALWLPPGHYRASVRLGQGFAAGIRLQPALQVDPGADCTPVLSATTGRLRVRLVDARGRPVLQEVAVLDRDGSRRGSCTTDSDGRIDLRLDPGNYSLCIWPPALHDEAARTAYLEAHDWDSRHLDRQRRAIGTVSVARGDMDWQTLTVADESLR